MQSTAQNMSGNAWARHLNDVVLYRRVLLSVSVLTYFLISLGGWVRNMGAGLSCPDWPLCFGKLIPHFDIQIFAEFFHRLVAGSVSIIFMGLLAWTIYNPEFRRQYLKPVIFSLILLFSQVILGGLTVLKLLKFEIVTLHLAFGTMFLASLIHTYKISDPQTPTANYPKALYRISVLAWGALFFQMLLGALVSSNGAGLACPDFPKCLGEWWPQFGGAVSIHFNHRLGALMATIVVGAFALNGLFSSQIGSHIKWNLKLILIVLGIQLLLGISNVLFQIPVSVGVLHLAGAELLFVLLMVTSYEIRNYPVR